MIKIDMQVNNLYSLTITLILQKHILRQYLVYWLKTPINFKYWYKNYRNKSKLNEQFMKELFFIVVVNLASNIVSSSTSQI